MGKSHVVSGWCAGALVAGAVGMPLPAVVGFGLVTAGASALNDLDHDQASASRVLGPLSRLLAELVQVYARLLYRLTRGPGDPKTKGAHRGATHALPLLPIPCAILAVLPHIASAVAGWIASWRGWDVTAAQLWAGPMAIAAVVGFCLLVAVDRLGSWLLIAAAGAALVLGVADGAVPLLLTGELAAAVAALTATAAAMLVSVAPWVALAVLVGTVTHVFCDWITEHGLYALAPLWRIDAGTNDEKRWVRLALPKWAAFKTGKWFEKGVVFPSLITAGLLVAPGAWSTAHALLSYL